MDGEIAGHVEVIGGFERALNYDAVFEQGIRRDGQLLFGRVRSGLGGEPVEGAVIQTLGVDDDWRWRSFFGGLFEQNDRGGRD